MNADAAAVATSQVNGQNGNGAGSSADSAPAPQPRGERGPRRERGERGGNRGERGERAPRATEGLEAAAAPAAGDFADTAPLASLPDLDLTGNHDAPANGNTPAGDEQRRERRSRDRYGRDRRERGPRENTGAEGQAPAPAMVDFDLTQASPAPLAAEEAPRRSYFSAPVAEQAQSAPAAAAPAAAANPGADQTVAVTAPAAAVQAPAATVAPVASVAPAAAPAAPVAPPSVAPEAAGMPRVQPFTLPMDALQEVAAASGLQWVNSDAEKVAAVQAAIAAEPKPERIPRERPPAVVLDEGPLVLVETRRDLAAMTLPFEQPPAA